MCVSYDLAGAFMPVPACASDQSALTNTNGRNSWILARAQRRDDLRPKTRQSRSVSGKNLGTSTVGTCRGKSNLTFTCCYVQGDTAQREDEALKRSGGIGRGNKASEDAQVSSSAPRCCGRIPSGLQGDATAQYNLGSTLHPVLRGWRQHATRGRLVARLLARCLSTAPALPREREGGRDDRRTDRP